MSNEQPNFEETKKRLSSLTSFEKDQANKELLEARQTRMEGERAGSLEIQKFVKEYAALNPETIQSMKSDFEKKQEEILREIAHAENPKKLQQELNSIVTKLDAIRYLGLGSERIAELIEKGKTAKEKELELYKKLSS